MTTKLTSFVTFALLSGSIILSQISAISGAKLTSDRDVVAKDSVHSPSIKQTPINEIKPLIFTPRARGEDEEYTGTSVAGGTYGPGECPDLEPPLTAFVPGDGETKTSFRSTTAKAEPTFWFYIPSPSKSQLSAEFKLMLIDDTTKEPVEEVIPNEKYRGKYELDPNEKKETDIFPIKIPTVLEFDKNYYWSFKIICDPNRRDSDIYVDGYITRIRPRQELNPSEVAATKQKALFYAREGLWHETISTLIEEVCPQDKQEAKSLITQLLASKYVGLASSAEQYVKTILSSKYCNPHSSQ